MKTYDFERCAWTKADADTVFALLADGLAWPEWSAIEHATIEQAGSRDPDGVGAIRAFTTGRITSREQVVAFERPGHFAYVLLSGLPLCQYRADVTSRGFAAGF